jgi:hypothetical protein
MTRFWLSDETNNSTEIFTIGSTLFIEGRGLHPSTLYDFHLSGETARESTTLLARYSADRHGILAATPLIPYVGLFTQFETLTQADAHRAFAERTFIIRASARQKTARSFEELKYTVTSRDRCRRIFACDARGRILTGIEQSHVPVTIALHSFEAGLVRVSAVPRQSGWRTGDPIDPVITRKGAICSRLFHHNGSRELIVKLAESHDMPSGSYQFIARAFPPGWHEAEESKLLPDDVVSDRRLACLEIRLPFNQCFGNGNGMVLTPTFAGRSH